MLRSEGHSLSVQFVRISTVYILFLERISAMVFIHGPLKHHILEKKHNPLGVGELL